MLLRIQYATAKAEKIRRINLDSSGGIGYDGGPEGNMPLIWSAELRRLPQFDGISLRVMQTSEAPNVGISFRVFDLNSCRS